MKDLLDKKPEEYEKERNKVAKTGWGNQLVLYQTKDQGWNNTTPSLQVDSSSLDDYSIKKARLPS